MGALGGLWWGLLGGSEEALGAPRPGAGVDLNRILIEKSGIPDLGPGILILVD